MKYLISALVGIVAIGFLSWAIPDAAVATPTLDQSCTEPNPPYSWTSGYGFGELTRAQTFKVGLSGQLTELDVLLDLSRSSSGLVQFDILPAFTAGATVDSLGTPLASQTLSWTMSSTPNWFALDFSAAHLFVTAGQMLAFVQRPTTAWGLMRNFDNLYPGGEILTTTFIPPQYVVVDETFSAYPEWDFGFKTWVDPAAVGSIPEPATMLLVGSGLVGLCGFRRRFKK